MKAKRRHDLKTNELAQTLQDARVFLQQHGGFVLGTVALVLLALVVGTVWHRTASRARAEEWRTYYTLSTLSGQSELSEAERIAQARALASQTGDRSLARLTLHLVARLAWSQAHEDSALDEQKLAEAEEAYERIVTEYADDPYSVGAAYRGLAAIAEERADQFEEMAARRPYIERAEEYYQKIVSDERLEGAPVLAVAQAQLATLEQRLRPVEIVEPPATQPATATQAAPAPVEADVPPLLMRPEPAATALTPTSTAPAATPGATVPPSRPADTQPAVPAANQPATLPSATTTEEGGASPADESTNP